MTTATEATATIDTALPDHVNVIISKTKSSDRNRKLQPTNIPFNYTSPPLQISLNVTPIDYRNDSTIKFYQ